MSKTAVSMYRFTIRDILWLIIVISMAGAWFTDHLQRRREVRDLQRAASEYHHAFILAEFRLSFHGESIEMKEGGVRLGNTAGETGWVPIPESFPAELEYLESPD